jgi:hypothetical protein
MLLSYILISLGIIFLIAFFAVPWTFTVTSVSTLQTRVLFWKFMTWFLGLGVSFVCWVVLRLYYPDQEALALFIGAGIPIALGVYSNELAQSAEWELRSELEEVKENEIIPSAPREQPSPPLPPPPPPPPDIPSPPPPITPPLSPSSESRKPNRRSVLDELTIIRDSCLFEFAKYPLNSVPEVHIANSEHFGEPKPSWVIYAHYEPENHCICFNQAYLDNDPTYEDLCDTMTHELLHAWMHTSNDSSGTKWSDRQTEPHDDRFEIAAQLLGIKFNPGWRNLD